MNKVIKVVCIFLGIVIVVGMIFFIIDNNRVSKQLKPIFCIKNPAGMIMDGGTIEYFGLGYKVIDFHTLGGFDDIKIGTWFMKYEDFEDEYNKYYLINDIATKNIDLEEIPEHYTMTKAIDDGCFVITNTNQIYNKNKLDEFIKKTEINAEIRKEASLRIVQFTTEGDMIITDISYDIEGDATEYNHKLRVKDPSKIKPSNYIVKIDSTRDKFSAKDDKKIITLDDFPGDFYGIVEVEKDNIIEVHLALYAEIDSIYAKQYEDYFICAYSKEAKEKAEISEDYIIVDTSENLKNPSFADALEEIYRDELYKYSLPCIKSEYIIVRYKDGSAENIITALRNKNISITDLDKFNIKYIKENIENENDNSFFGTIIESNANNIIVQPYENEKIHRR